MVRQQRSLQVGVAAGCTDVRNVGPSPSSVCGCVLCCVVFVIACCVCESCNCSSISNFPQNVVMFLGIRIWRLWGSTFLGKGTAETRLFGEGKVVEFRKVHLDRGWCNIQHRLGWGGVGCLGFVAFGFC